jgi:hypothetical protein
MLVIEDGEPSQQRVTAAAPPITTTTNPTNLRVLVTQPQTHLHATRANTPGTTASIATPAQPNQQSICLNPDAMGVEEAITPNLNSMIPLWHPNVILQEVTNLVTEATYYDTTMDIWTPEKIVPRNNHRLQEACKRSSHERGADIGTRKGIWKLSTRRKHNKHTRYKPTICSQSQPD